MASKQARPDAVVLHGLYAGEGLTVVGVAARLGVSRGTAHKWLIEARVAMRPSPFAARTDVDDDEIRRLYVDHGWTATEIASALGSSPSTVYGRLERLGVARRPPSPRQSIRPADPDLADLLFRQRLSIAVVADRFSVSRQAVYGWVRAAGIQLPTPGTETDWCEAVELYRSGWSTLRVARWVGCSPATVCRRLEAAGVARRHSEPAVTRVDLIEGLAAGESAPAMAARLGVSATTVCRELKRHGLQTARQATRARAAEQYVRLLENAIADGREDPVTLDELRRRVAGRWRRSSRDDRGLEGRQRSPVRAASHRSR